MSSDDELLSEFRSGSSAAFGQLMARHRDWVYSAALRRVGDAQLAEDVTQAVFLALAQKGAMANGAALAAWLFTVVRYTSAGANRERARRRRREAAAAKARPEMTQESADWTGDVAPLLEEAVASLRSGDRRAVLLRFYQRLSFSDVGRALGTTEEAARKRVARAVEKLRVYFDRSGVAIPSATLATHLLQHVVQQAPPAVVAKLGAAGAARETTRQLLDHWLRHARRKLLLKVGGVAVTACSAAVILVAASMLPRQPSRIVVPRPAPAAAAAAPNWVTRTAAKWQQGKQGRFVGSGVVDQRGRVWLASEEKGIYLNEGGDWKHFGTADGLGGVSVTAIACDAQGRIWAGHNRNGVSVYNGQKWKNYDATDGPLGSHVTGIRICPASAPRGGGDVWLISELGLARYSVANNVWSYFTRAQGLPSDQAASLDFDAQGNLYLGTRCDGLAIGRAADDYKTWRIVRGADRQPPVATGSGLPSNIINAVLVAHDGAVFVATDHGLARSTDAGEHWTFIRGKDWAAKLQGSFDGPPEGWTPSGTAPLAEDYIAALAEDEKGTLWVGYRTKGYQSLDEPTLKVLTSNESKVADYCDLILPIPGEPPLIGTRGYGLTQAGGAMAMTLRVAPDPTGPTPALPAPAAPPDADELDRMAQRVNAAPDSKTVAALLAEDWVTQGDWVGRYGQQQSYWPPRNIGIPAAAAGYSLFNAQPRMGPHSKDEGGVIWYTRNDADGRSLYIPSMGRRFQAEWNDGGYQESYFGPDWEGPDLWFDVTVPAGVHRVTLYIQNIGNNNGTDRRRDYTVELRHYTTDLPDAQHAPALAIDRVMPSQNPAYRTFLVSEGRYLIRVASNYSQMVSVQAIFFDAADFTGTGASAPSAPYLYGLACEPPQPGPARSTDSAQLRSARALWAALDARYAGAPELQLPYRLLAYRAAQAAGADRDLLANWRWNLHLWTNADRAEWEKLMAAARKRLPHADGNAKIE